MSAEYDFTKIVNTVQLKDEIYTAALPTPSDIQLNDTALQIFFSSDLTTDQQATLATVVQNHTPTTNYVTLYTQNQITKLTGYLNNANPTIVSTARAVMILNIAPRLPADLLAAINSQIQSIVGS